MSMIVEIICEKKNSKAVYTYYEVEEISVIGDRFIIHQKDDIPYVGTFDSEHEIHVKEK